MSKKYALIGSLLMYSIYIFVSALHKSAKITLTLLRLSLPECDLLEILHTVLDFSHKKCNQINENRRSRRYKSPSTSILHIHLLYNPKKIALVCQHKFKGHKTDVEMVKQKGTDKDWALSAPYWHRLTFFFMNRKLPHRSWSVVWLPNPSVNVHLSTVFLVMMTFSVNYNMWLTSSDDSSITVTTQPQNTEAWNHLNPTQLFHLYPEEL